MLFNIFILFSLPKETDTTSHKHILSFYRGSLCWNVWFSINNLYPLMVIWLSEPINTYWRSHTFWNNWRKHLLLSSLINHDVHGIVSSFLWLATNSWSQRTTSYWRYLRIHTSSSYLGILLLTLGMLMQRIILPTALM